MRRYGKRFGLAVLLLLLAFLGRVGWLFVVAFQQQQRNQRLVLAVEHNDTRAVLSLLQQGADPNLRDVKVPPFSLRQHLQLLLDQFRGLRPQAPPTQGASTQDPSLLAVAVGKSNVPIAQALLERGAKDVDARIAPEYREIPVVQFAAEKQHPDLASALLRHGAAAHSKVDRNALLQICAFNGYTDIAAYLLARDTDVNGGVALTRNDVGDTPLQLAAAGGHREMVRLLLARGARVNVPVYVEHTALIEAAELEDDDLVRLLLAHKAEVDAACKLGTPLMFAANRGSLKVVKTLVEAGAKVNGYANYSNVSLEAARSGNVQVVKYLLDKGALVDQEGKGEFTPLIAAIFNGDVAIAKLLLDRGADVNHRAWFGTALYQAVGQGNLRLVKLLLAHGADPNIRAQTDDEGREFTTVLSTAETQGYTEIAALLKKAGAKRQPPSAKTSVHKP